MTDTWKYNPPGRPKNQGKFGCPTKVIRVPVDRVDEIYQYLQSESIELPLYLSKVPAGFPSPADDYVEKHIDLNKFLVSKPAATHIIKVIGDSMINVGIFPNDLLIVDRSIEPIHNKIVIAIVDGEFTVKRLYKQGDVIKLLAENAAYPPIEIKGELEIWGVVQHVIHSFTGTGT